MDEDWGFDDPFSFPEPFVRDDKPFRLLDLPAEIWSKIGKMAIDEDADPELRICKFAPPYADHYQHPITRTCRALREECLPHFFKAGFKLECGTGYEALRLGKLLKTLRKTNRQAMRDVRVLGSERSTAKEASEVLRDCGWDFEFELGEGNLHLGTPIHDEDGYWCEEFQAYWVKFL